MFTKITMNIENTKEKIKAHVLFQISVKIWVSHLLFFADKTSWKSAMYFSSFAGSAAVLTSLVAEVDD